MRWHEPNHSQRHRHEIQSLFDPQVEGIVKKVIEELDWLRDTNNPNQVVSTTFSPQLTSSK